MVNDLHTETECIKYMDDMTLTNDVSTISSYTKMQECIDKTVQWINSSKMIVNSKKTKEMLISFKRSPPEVAPTIINDNLIERVTVSKLFGVKLRSALKWDDHIRYCLQKGLLSTPFSQASETCWHAHPRSVYIL